MNGMLFIVSAPSGAGKTTLCKELSGVMPSLAHSISHTTRKPRPGEVEGEHYYFVTGDEFRRIADGGGFAEWAAVHGNLYGTSRAELKRLFDLGKDVKLDIDTQGATQIKSSGVPGVFIFILPPSMEELEKRLRGRETDDEEEIKRRLKRAQDEIKSYKEYDYVIVNKDFTVALDALRAVVIAEKNTVDRVDRVWMNEKFSI